MSGGERAQIVRIGKDDGSRLSAGRLLHCMRIKVLRGDMLRLARHRKALHDMREKGVQLTLLLLMVLVRVLLHLA